MKYTVILCPTDPQIQADINRCFVQGNQRLATGPGYAFRRVRASARTEQPATGRDDRGPWLETTGPTTTKDYLTVTPAMLWLPHTLFPKEKPQKIVLRTPARGQEEGPAWMVRALLGDQRRNPP